MNTVLSAFNKSKNDSKQKTSKKLTQDSSYENLRHIREIGSSSKMNTFHQDDIGQMNVTKRLSGGPQPIIVVSDQVIQHKEQGDDTVDCCTTSVAVVAPIPLMVTEYSDKDHSLSQKPPLQYTVQKNSVINSNTIKEPSVIITNGQEQQLSIDIAPELDAVYDNAMKPTSETVVNEVIKENGVGSHENRPIIMGPSGRLNDTTKSNRLSKPRLSLSGLNNSTMPAVHRPNVACGNNAGGHQKVRLSTHQRNLSLDFR